MRIIEGLLPEDKLAIIRWTNSKGADFLQQWAGDTLSYPLTIEALNALSHCFRIEAEGNFIGMIQEIIYILVDFLSILPLREKD